MVVGTIGIYPHHSFAISNVCRLCSSSIHILSVLMKKAFKYINKVTRLVNRVVVWIALLLTYLVIYLYHFLLHKKAQIWIYNEKEISLEQTKHLW